MKFKVHRYWQLCDTVEVEAASLDKAIDAARQIPLDNATAEYVSGSLNSDPECDVHPIPLE